MRRAEQDDPRLVSLAKRRLETAAFDALFAQGMALVEEAAAYLDGAGREESARLSRTALNAYAQHSLKLSTRLMQLASWLLLQRSLREGEIRPATAERERGKIDLAGPPREHAQEALLPEALAALISRSYDLQEEIARLEAGLALPQEPVANAVAGQIRRLRSSFEGE